MTHIVLLGDSSFDNSTYVGRDPDVTAHLRGLLPPGGRVTLLAVDGAVSRGVLHQAAAIPADATHLVLSVGGNDALMRADVLETPVEPSAEALLLLADAVVEFEQSYRAAVAAVLARGLPLVVCAIYNASFPEVDYQRCVQVAVAVYDDAIIRVAAQHGLCRSSTSAPSAPIPPTTCSTSSRRPPVGPGSQPPSSAPLRSPTRPARGSSARRSRLAPPR